MIYYFRSRYPVSSIDRSPTIINKLTNHRCTSSIIVYFTLCYLFTSAAYTRGRERSSQWVYPLKKYLPHPHLLLTTRILLTYATIMFVLSTTHVALAVSELLQGFVYELDSTPGGPPVFYRINVFPKRKAIYIVNVCALIFSSLLYLCIKQFFFLGIKCLCDCWLSIFLI